MNTRERIAREAILKARCARIGRGIDEFVREEYLLQGVGIAETAKNLGLDPQSVRAAVGRARADLAKGKIKCSA